MKDKLNTELAECMREVAESKVGSTDFEKIAQLLIDRYYIREVTPEKRKQIRHDFKRISSGLKGIADSLDELFIDILSVVGEDNEV